MTTTQRLDSARYTAFLQQVLAQTTQHLVLLVRPAGRIHLEVKVLYDPGRGNR